MENYTVHVEYLDELLEHARANNGATGAERARLIQARKFIWKHWKNTQRHMDCQLEAIKGNKDLSGSEKKELRQQVHQNKKAIKHLLIAKSKQHSVRCLYRMLIKRTTWRNLYLEEQGA